jgi:hypothetical protein
MGGYYVTAAPTPIEHPETIMRRSLRYYGVLTRDTWQCEFGLPIPGGAFIGLTEVTDNIEYRIDVEACYVFENAGQACLAESGQRATCEPW